MTEARLVVQFAPRLWEAFWATLVLVVGLWLAAMGVVPLFWQPTTNVACDRKTCTIGGRSVIGIASEYTLDVPDLANSRVERKGGETTWVVTNKGQRLQMSNPTDQDGLVAQYARVAKDFDAFLHDPAQKTFSESWTGGGGPSIWLFLILGAAITAWGVKWRRGWRSKLVFDKAAGTLEIRQRPWKATRKVSLADVGSIDVRDTVFHSVYGNFRWETVTLSAREGKPVWKTRVMFTRKTYQQIQDKVRQIRELLISR
ncbi:MAG: hypothetical protein ACM31C_15000 [Acidobacteriota bacterium]